MGLMNCVVQDICLLLEGNTSQFFSFWYFSIFPLPPLPYVGMSGQQRPAVIGDGPKVSVFCSTCCALYCTCLRKR